MELSQVRSAGDCFELEYFQTENVYTTRAQLSDKHEIFAKFFIENKSALSIEKTENRVIMMNNRISLKRKGGFAMPDTKTVTVNGKKYPCKRYTTEELEETFSDCIVVLDDTRYKNMNLVSGILVDIFDISMKNKMREKYMEEGKNYDFLDLYPEPLLIGYKEFGL